MSLFVVFFTTERRVYETLSEITPSRSLSIYSSVHLTKHKQLTTVESSLHSDVVHITILSHAFQNSRTSITCDCGWIFKTNEMRLAILNCLIFVIEFLFCIAALHGQEESSVGDQDILSRKKRYLSFPDGSILQASGFWLDYDNQPPFFIYTIHFWYLRWIKLWPHDEQLAIIT